MKYIEFLKSDLVYDSQRILDNHGIICDISDSKLKRIECNITLKVLGKCYVHQVLAFLNMCFCDTTNKVFQCPGSDFKYKKETETVEIPKIKKPHEYVIKCYDKTKDERRGGNLFVENDLLRIEIVFLSRSIKKMFGGKITIDDVLTRESLSRVIEEYKRLFTNVVFDQYVTVCRNDIIEKLLEDLMEYESVNHMVMAYKEVILDQSLIQQALKRWYNIRNMPDYSWSRLDDYKNKGIVFPKDVIKTLSVFNNLCQ